MMLFKFWRKTHAHKNLPVHVFTPLSHRRFFSTGLYGLPGLLNNNPKGFLTYASDSTQRIQKLVSYICESEDVPPPTKTIEALDEIFSTAGIVIQASALCSETHPDHTFVMMARKAQNSMETFQTDLLRSSSLYDAVKRLEKNFNTLSEEDQIFVEKLKLKFENEGCQLCLEKRHRLDSVRHEIDLLRGTFLNNIKQDPGNVDVYPSSRIPDDLHYAMEPINKSNGEEGFRIWTDESTATDVLQYLPDDEIKKLVYIEKHSRPHANIEILQRFHSAHYEEAELFGFKSYGEAALQHTMASSPEVVRTFLTEMSNIVKTKYTEELNQLKKFKVDANFKPWNVEYYMQQMSDSYGAADIAYEASLHFSMSNCLDGLNEIVKSLFGATISITESSPEFWHDDVRKLTLSHSEEGELGYIYLDLFERASKTVLGCCTYQIRPARRISPTQFELPIAAIVCHFDTSWDGRLFPTELETLFHEFGHALHSLLSRTERQLLSGTQVASDVLEIPSVFFEHFARDYRVLRKFARHNETNAEISQNLVEWMHYNRCMFYGRELQHQILKSLVDQALFGDSHNLSLAVNKLETEHSNMEHVEGTLYPDVLRFDHLLTYRAVYYSYLYGECVAATFWKNVCEEDPLSPTVGSALRKLLQPGGAKNPVTLLGDVLGVDVFRYSDSGGIMPNLSSLCSVNNL